MKLPEAAESVTVSADRARPSDLGHPLQQSTKNLKY